MQFVGDPTLFIFRNVIKGLGPLSGRLIADFGDFHEFLGVDAQYRFDGVGIAEVGEHFWRDILRQIDPSRLSRSLSHFDEENGELLWIVPLTTDNDATAGPETANTEHYLEETAIGTSNIAEREVSITPFTQRFIPATATGFFERQTTLTWDALTSPWSDQSYRWNDQFFVAAFPFNLFGDKNGNLFIMNTANSFDGADITSTIRFGTRALGDGRAKGLLKRLYLFFDQDLSATQITVNILTADSPGENRQVEGTFTFDTSFAQDDIKFVSPFLIARYFTPECTTTGTGKVWALQGYDTDILPAGER